VEHRHSRWKSPSVAVVNIAVTLIDRSGECNLGTINSNNELTSTAPQTQTLYSPPGVLTTLVPTRKGFPRLSRRANTLLVDPR